MTAERLYRRGFGTDRFIDNSTRSTYNCSEFHSTRNEALPGVKNQMGYRTDDIIDMLDVMDLRHDIFKVNVEPNS